MPLQRLQARFRAVAATAIECHFPVGLGVFGDDDGGGRDLVVRIEVEELDAGGA